MRHHHLSYFTAFLSSYSAPALLASSLFLNHVKFTPISGPLHLPFPLPGMPFPRSASADADFTPRHHPCEAFPSPLI